MAKNFLGDVPIAKHGTVVCRVIAVSSGTDKKYVLWTPAWDVKIIAIRKSFDTAVTGNDTNSLTSKVINLGSAGTGTTLIASKAYTTGVNAAILVPETLTNSSTAANLLVSAGDTVGYLSDQSTGTGLSDPAGTVEIDYQIQ